MRNFSQLEPPEKALIEELITYYASQHEKYDTFLGQMKASLTSNSLSKLVHSMKWRLKDENSLREKLAKKLEKDIEAGVVFHITQENLFEEITDLAGFRILHLHTKQMDDIHPLILGILDESQLQLKEEPTAKYWDEEYKKYFESIGIRTESSPRLYTSVHYVIYSNLKTKLTGEIQVRTLAEELWGEADHSINYPNQSDIPSCSEQILVLARVTSSCTRLVDSIFKTHKEGLRSSGVKQISPKQ